MLDDETVGRKLPAVFLNKKTEQMFEKLLKRSCVECGGNVTPPCDTIWVETRGKRKCQVTT